MIDEMEAAKIRMWAFDQTKACGKLVDDKFVQNGMSRNIELADELAAWVMSGKT